MNTAQSALCARVREIDERLQQEYPDARCELDFTTALELLQATVLSTQSTDKKVNQVTPVLFARYPDAQSYAQADPEEIERIIRPTGFHRMKTKSLIGIGTVLVRDYAGEVPGTLAELVTLPGVGRKTANVVLGNVFGVPGITVDTHLGRLTRRWQLTDEQDPVRVERVLQELVPEADWTMFSHRTIFHGRRVCTARAPRCTDCVLIDLCPEGVSRLAAR